MFRNGQVLLLRLPAGKGAWGGLLNGIGGHVEVGEAPTASARREIVEETGLSPGVSLRLCGIIHIETREDPGVMLLVFGGDAPDGQPQPGPEGDPVWVDVAELAGLPVVEDLPRLVPLVEHALQSHIPFTARYHYDAKDRLNIVVEPTPEP